MSALGDLEAALWAGGVHRLAESHSHRATSEDSMAILKGRDAIAARWVSQGPEPVEIDADLGEMVAVRGEGWRLHRWVWREDKCILREVEVGDRPGPRDEAPVHPPLGELRSGLGQFAAAPRPDLPPGFPEAAIPFAAALHSAWNGRDLTGLVPDALRTLLRDLPDATFFFEHAAVVDTAAAILFRVMGHHANGRRIRLIGSALARGDTLDVLIDTAAYEAQLRRELIDYA